MDFALTPRRIDLENEQMVKAVDVCPEGRTVLIGQYASDGPPVLCTYDAPTGARQVVIDKSRYRNVEAARFFGSSRAVAYVTGEPALELADITPGGSQSRSLPLPDARPGAISVSASGTRCVVGGTQVSIVEGAKVLASVAAPATRPSGEPARVAIAPHGMVAAAGVEERCVALLDGSSGALVQRLAPAPAYASWIQFARGGEHVVAIEGHSKGVYGWHVPSGERWLTDVLDERSQSYTCGAFHPDGTRLYLGTFSGYIAVIQLDGGRMVWEGRVCVGRIWDMAASGNYLAFGGDDGAWISAI